jgi:membrane protein DedA with SNARE-associated domain
MNFWAFWLQVLVVTAGFAAGCACGYLEYRVWRTRRLRRWWRDHP